MKVTSEMVSRAKEIASDPYREFEHIGIRVQDDYTFELGMLNHVSHIWDDGDDTGEELPGVCVIRADRAELANTYYGDHIAIIGGNHIEYGEDDGELIVSDPVVIEVLA